MGKRTSFDHSLDSEACLFEIEQQGQIQACDAQVSQHLSDVRVGKCVHHFRVDDHRRIHYQIWNQRPEQMSLVAHLIVLLLLDLHAAFAQLDHQRILVKLFIQPRLQFVENRLRCSDDLLTRFLMFP